MERPLHGVVYAPALGMVWKLDLYLKDGLVVRSNGIPDSFFQPSYSERLWISSLTSVNEDRLYGKQFLGSEFLITKATPEKWKIKIKSYDCPRLWFWVFPGSSAGWRDQMAPGNPPPQPPPQTMWSWETKCQISKKNGTPKMSAGSWMGHRREKTAQTHRRKTPGHQERQWPAVTWCQKLHSFLPTKLEVLITQRMLQRVHRGLTSVMQNSQPSTKCYSGSNLKAKAQKIKLFPSSFHMFQKNSQEYL